MYGEAGPRIRRLINQAFFTRIYIDLDGSARGQLAPPVARLLNEDLLRSRAKPQRRSRKAVPATRHARVRPLVLQWLGSTEKLLVLLAEQLSNPSPQLKRLLDLLEEIDK
jgi:hypothetical protein